MQMNRWLTNVEAENGEYSERASHRPIRPRASVWIDPIVKQNVSASSIAQERQIPSPQTPIPARASAQRSSRSVKVRPRYSRNQTMPQDSDITRIPTLPQPKPTMWQYELPDYEAESSLSSLSLAHPEAVDCAIDEIDTLPPSRSRAIDEIDTRPPPLKHNTLAAQKSPVTIERENTKGKLFSLPFLHRAELRRQKSLTLPLPHSLSEIVAPSPEAATVAIPRIPAVNEKRDLIAGVGSRSVGVESTSPQLIEEAASWTAGQGKDSRLAKRIASRSNDRRGQRRNSISLNPIDRVRWWLLYPGRIEFLLWLNGTIVLVGVTCLFLFATLLSTGWMSAGLSSVGVDSGGVQMLSTPGSTATSSKSSCTAENASSPQCHSTTVVSSSGLKLTLIDDAILLPGVPIYLHGQGFSANNTVTFTYDTSLPCRPNATSTDMQGAFSVYLLLGVGVKAGTHQIVAYDVATKNTIKVYVTISPLPIGKALPPPPTPVPPGVTPTATTAAGGSGGGLPTPIGQTPVLFTPTVAVTPTSVSTQRPTPTVKITPSPTVGVTPTVGITPTVASTTTPTGTKDIGSALVLQNALYDESVDGHISFSLWLWVAIVGYTLSMIMLGTAGLLYRRNRRLSSR